jgi:hypothetical protein
MPFRTRLAEALSEVFCPAVQVLVQSALVLWPVTSGALAWDWYLQAAFIGSALPTLFLLHGARRGWWLNHHIPDRERRVVPMLVILAFIVIGGAFLAVAGAPRPLCAVFWSLAIGLAALTLITRWWKISVHNAGAGMTVGVAVVTYGPTLLFLAPLCLATIWMRVHLRAHTLPQATTGALVGGAVAWAVFAHLA